MITLFVKNSVRVETVEVQFFICEIKVHKADIWLYNIFLFDNQFLVPLLSCVSRDNDILAIEVSHVLLPYLGFWSVKSWLRWLYSLFMFYTRGYVWFQTKFCKTDIKPIRFIFPLKTVLNCYICTWSCILHDESLCLCLSFNELSILVRSLYRLIISHTRDKKSITSWH